jgi:thiamine-monophosphate kinase
VQSNGRTDNLSQGRFAPLRRCAITVGDLGEFGLIARSVGRLPAGRRTLLGPGDDAAVVATPDGRVVATTDLLVEGRHFRRDWSSGYDVGRKAAAQNLADVAAMGAVPTALLVGLGCPPDLPLDWTDQLAAGLADECGPLGVGVAGGDTVRADPIVIAITALGDLEGRAAVPRSGARPGDVVAVAGRLGWSAAGLELLGRGVAGPDEILAAHRRPTPPYDEGPAASLLGATAMIDVSDGLLADLGHVARASGVGITLDRPAFEVPAPLRVAADLVEVDPYDWILTGGEDHALAATFPAGTPLPSTWRPVGNVVAGQGVFVDGKRFAREGFDHFGETAG